MKRHIYCLILTLFAFITGVKAVSATTIEFWTTQTQSDRMKTIQLLMDTFQALNSDITVKLVPVDENEVPSQIAAASAAGNLPGIIEGSSELMLAFGEEGILDTKGATKMVNQIGKDRFYQGALRLVESPESGTYYSLPYHGWVQGIWYRSDWFKEAGLAAPDTWDHILKAAKTFYKPEKNQYGILVGTNVETYAEQCFTHFALSNGASEFNSKGELIFNSENFPDLKGTTFDPKLVDNTRVAPTISKVKSAGYGAMVSLALIKQDDNKKREAAQRLLAFMYEPTSYITFLHMAPGGMNPMLRDIAGKPEYLNDPKGVFKRYGRDKIEEIIAGLDNIGSFTIVSGRAFPDSGKIYAKKIIPRMIYDVTIEGKAPKEAIQWAEEQMKKVISD